MAPRLKGGSDMDARQLVGKLFWIEGNVTIKEGVLWLPDGSAIDLLTVMHFEG